MKQILLALTSTVLAFVATPVLACDQMIPQTSNWNLGTDPQPTLQIEVRRNNPNFNCEWFVTIDRGAHNNGTYNRLIQNGTPKLPIQIYNETQTQVLMDLPDAVYPNNVLSGNFTSGDGLSKITKFKMVLGTVPYSTPTGTYQNTWQLKLYVRPNSNAAWQVRHTSNTGAQYPVQPSVDLSLTDSGQPFNLWDTTQVLDFGTIAESEELSFDMHIGSNRPYRYTFSSANGGKLRRTNGANVAANTINYQTTIGSNAYSSQVTIASYPFTSARLSPPAGTVLKFPVSVKILESPAAKNAGDYQDIITITVTAQ